MSLPDTFPRTMTESVGIARSPLPDMPSVIGFLPGEGVGPQLTEICLQHVAAISEIFGRTFETRIGGPIGLEGLREAGNVIPDEVGTFCRNVFASGGAVIAGPGGGRFVYDMRRRFELFLKFNPLRAFPELEPQIANVRRLAHPVDIIVVRENLGGLYQGESRVWEADGERHVEHSFGYRERDVLRVTEAAARLAATRRGVLTVVAKDSGLPDLSRLWFDCGRQSAERHGVALRTADIDFAVYQFVSAPDQFDVVAVPNCFGDILADLGGVFCGSRGCTFGGSFSERAAVYQTNHGAAYDLAGTNTANPVGHILALAMMLRESYNLPEEAAAIVAAVREAWALGWRTADLMAPGCRLASTTQFGNIVLDNLLRSGRTRSWAAA